MYAYIDDEYTLASTPNCREYYADTIYISPRGYLTIRSINIYFLYENSSIIVDGGLNIPGFYVNLAGYMNNTWKGIQFNSNKNSFISVCSITNTNKGNKKIIFNSI